MRKRTPNERPCPRGWRRLVIPAMKKQRWEALFDFLIEDNEVKDRKIIGLWTEVTRFVLINSHNGVAIERSDYEFFRQFNPGREADMMVETNADDDAVVWFRMKYL